jgi:hypothetical protein
MPLIVDDEKSYELARRYYPQVESRHRPNLEWNLRWLAEEFDALFECKYWPAHLKHLFRELYQKEMRLVFCPHGQSDKGFRAPLLAPYVDQDAVLLYGDLMIQMLKELGLWSSMSRYAVVGNYRLLFYQKHRSFYEAIVEKEFPIDKKKKTLLYAPTWRDADDATSFFRYGAEVIRQLPSDWNLLLKLHPLLEQRDPAQFYSIQALSEKKPNIHLIHEFPPVYPLLALADAYLGDASSVGYDFLFFEKPLYFFPTDYPGRLHTSGREIDVKKIYSGIEMSNALPEEGKKLYHFAFGEMCTEAALREAIRTATCS